MVGSKRGADKWPMVSQIAKFMGPTWGPPGSCRPQMGPMLAGPVNLAIRAAFGYASVWFLMDESGSIETKSDP